MRIGFIGLGRMGAGMAANLVRTGNEVTVFNRTEAKADPLVKLGARRARSIAEACHGDLVFTMVANDEAARDLLFGHEGILASLPRGSTHCSSSTISVALSRHMADLHRDEGQRYLATPVFGRPEAAEAAQLQVLAGGDVDVFAQVKPLLAVLGQHVFHVGPRPEMANAVKLSGNFMICAAMEALGEAMAFASRHGVEPEALTEILTTTLFNAPIYHTYGALIASRSFRPAKFAAPLGTKDIRLLLEAAGAERVPMPLASLVHDRQLRVLATQGEDIDWSALGGLAFDDAGIAPKGA
jgi:3-hydroxyisobutyrate dehydrogenase-like beta-hydroxyacid dehydrogenase